MAANPIPIETLLAETTWVRALAGSLVADDATADDVAQQTLRAAIRRPPRAGVPVRAWLRTVARNFARRSHRERSRRTRRERAVAAPEADRLPAPDELAERLETQRAVARLVASLDEPYRSTVLLRYWEGHSAAEIARRQDLPAGTVRWRLKKALDDLRSRLDAEHDGDRTAWIALLLPIALPSPAPAPNAGGAATAAATGLGGALAVKKTAVIALVVVLAVVGLHFAGVFGDDPLPAAPAAPDAPPPVDAASVAKAGPKELVADTGPTGSPAGAAAENVTDESSSEAVVQMRFVDDDGRPIASVTVKQDGDRPEVRSGADGVAVLRIPMKSAESWAYLEARADGRVARSFKVAIRRGETTPLGDARLDPAGAVSGTVFGPDGKPAAGAKVRVAKPQGPLDPDPETLVDGPHADFEGVSGEDGGFRIDGIPLGYWKVWAGGDGLAWTATEPVEVRADREQEGVAIRPEATEKHGGFRVLVLDPEGKPLPFARITYYLRTAEGRFFSSGSLPADEDGRKTFRQYSAASGDFTARDPEERWGEAHAAGCPAGGEEIVLRLTKGSPIVVVATDAAGAPLPAFETVFVDVGNDTEIRDVKGTDGRIELIPPGQTFRIRVDAEFHRSETAGPFTPGDVPPEVRLSLGRLPGVHGRVTAGGKPLAGARVVAKVAADPRSYLEYNGFIVNLRPGTAGETVTADDGSFALCPRQPGRLVLRAEAEGWAPAESAAFEYDPEMGADGIEIQAGRGGAIEGTVVAPAGGDRTGTIVGISRGDTYGRTVRVGEDGKFRFERLTPGPFEVAIRDDEVLPGQNAWTAGGTAKPIPFNCRVVAGETTVVDLRLPEEPATLTGRVLVDGAAPRAWKAALYPPGASLSSVAETDVGEDGAFRLRAPEGTWRLLVTSPGGTHVSTVAVAEVRLAGETRWEAAWRTGRLDWERPDTIGEDDVLYHRIEATPGVLVLTPLRPDATEIRVPAGQGEIVRFSLTVWSQPTLWPRVAEVEVR